MLPVSCISVNEDNVERETEIYWCRTALEIFTQS